MTLLELLGEREKKKKLFGYPVRHYWIETIENACNTEASIDIKSHTTKQ